MMMTMVTRRLISIALQLGIVSVLLLGAACTQTESPTAAPPTSVPTSSNPPTAVSAPTSAPMPTNVPAPTDAPTLAATTQPAAEPTAAQPTSDALPSSYEQANGNVYAFRVIPEETFVEYAVNEVLFGNKQITRGRTNAVEGDFRLGVKDGKIFFDFTKLRVDLRTLKSDNDLRDSAIRRRWLESDRYPYAEFVAREIQEFPADAQLGQDVKFKVVGDMTIREITKPATFDVTVRAEGNRLIGTGVTTIFMKDYGFDPPEILGRFTVSDPATITVTGVAEYVPAE